jgi:hypothetical protein
MDHAERRISCRTKTRLRMTLRRGQIVLEGQCVELSQSGMLVEIVGCPDGIWPYANVALRLPNGTVHAVTRRVERRGKALALAIVEIDDLDQQRLTDFLFSRMLVEAKRAGGRSRRARLRMCAVA